LGRGCPLPNRLRGLAERRELPRGVWETALAANAFLAYLRPTEHFGYRENSVTLLNNV